MSKSLRRLRRNESPPAPPSDAYNGYHRGGIFARDGKTSRSSSSTSTIVPHTNRKLPGARQTAVVIDRIGDRTSDARDTLLSTSGRKTCSGNIPPRTVRALSRITTLLPNIVTVELPMSSVVWTGVVSADAVSTHTTAQT